jgi:hypothetical protein
VAAAAAPRPGGPPWLWLIVRATLPLLWGLDRCVEVPILRPLSGSVLLVPLAGWPLAVLAVVPAALMAALSAHLSWVDAL